MVSSGVETLDALSATRPLPRNAENRRLDKVTMR
jgi:hypothetical protein